MFRNIFVRSKTSTMLRKERLAKSNFWKEKAEKLRTGLVACIVIVGRYDYSGPSNPKLLSIYIDLWFQCNRNAERPNSDIIAASLNKM